MQAVNAMFESALSDCVQGWCAEDSEIEALPEAIADEDGASRADFEKWLVENEMLSAAETNYQSQVVSAGRGLDAKGCPVWQDYVAGTDSWDEDSVFTATVTMEDGVPKVRWVPELSAEESQRRVYTTQGQKNLGEGWTDVSNLSDTERKDQGYRFFQVEVDLRQ